MQAAVRPHLFEIGFQFGDLARNLSAVDLQLRFTGAAQANAARAATGAAAPGLTRQVRPLACQPRQAVFILRQFNLQRAFAGARVLREYVEDQGRSVQQTNGFPKLLFQFALMARR